MKKSSPSSEPGATKPNAFGKAERFPMRQWKARAPAKWEVVVKVENLGGAKADRYKVKDRAVIHLASGEVIVVEGKEVAVYRSYEEWNMWWKPIATVTIPRKPRIRKVGYFL